MKLPLSGSQTVGPYFAIGMEPLCSTAVPGAEGKQVMIEGRLIDANGAPIPDGFLEVWQAGSDGRYSSTPADSPEVAIGFARVKTDADGIFRFQTIKPGAVPYDDTHEQAPHLVVLVYMRGLLRHLYTRLYFADDPSIERDPILQLVTAHRRHTLIAVPDVFGVFHWDIVMRNQAETLKEETVFFAW
jgi:protocatechuate 3,4-dioxygenase alpha subunit